MNNDLLIQRLTERLQQVENDIRWIRFELDRIRAGTPDVQELIYNHTGSPVPPDAFTIS